MAEQHSIVGPSGLHAILLCPGKVRLEKDLPRSSSFAAAQGTVAHQLCELALNDNKLPDVGTVIECEGFNIEVDHEMISGVQVYLDEINRIREDVISLDTVEMVEGKASLEPFGIPEVWGTTDYAMSVPFMKLYVRDFKYGAGVMVDPENNPQLMAYALGAAGSMIDSYDVIDIGIVQPRGRSDENVKTWQVSPDHLKEWAENTLKPAVKLALSDDAPLVPGEEQCRFCGAKSFCHAIAEASLRSAMVDFKEFSTFSPDNPALLTIEQVAEIYGKIKLINQFTKAIEAAVFNTLAVGGVVPGYKLVKGRASRSWSDENKAADILEELIGDEAWEHKLLSPAKAEKILDKEEKKMIQDLIVSTDGTPSIVPENDKKPAITLAQEDFKKFQLS